MNPGITAKLFIAFLLTNIVTAVAVGFGVRTAFDRGFEKYIEEREDARRTRLASEFAAAYKRHGNWDFVRGDDAQWVQFNTLVRPPRPDGFRGPSGQAGARFDRGMPFGRPPAGALLDAKGGVVVGDAPMHEATARKAVVVDGRRVGELAFERRMPFEPVEQRFQQEIWQASLIVAFAVMVFSGVVAWFLSRGLLAPVRRLTAATRRLADGQYDTRVRSSSRDELGRLADDFNRLGNALAKNEASRRQFMADVSHELRTPLAVLKGELEAIDDGVRAADKDAIASLQGEVTRLSKLVDDIHDLSLADVGGMAYRFERVDLGAVVGEVLEHASGRLTSNGITARFDPPGAPVLVRADAQRLSQLLSNLLENSLRYTDAGGSLRAVVGRHDNKATLAWEDSKPGVPAEALPRLFERLYRVETSRTRATGGSGLGLAIARSIVEAHGGKIAASASVLGGVRIDVQLPLERK